MFEESVTDGACYAERARAGNCGRAELCYAFASQAVGRLKKYRQGCPFAAFRAGRRYGVRGQQQRRELLFAVLGEEFLVAGVGAKVGEVGGGVEGVEIAEA